MEVFVAGGTGPLGLFLSKDGINWQVKTNGNKQIYSLCFIPDVINYSWWNKNNLHSGE
jgi:hypothetical protein